MANGPARPGHFALGGKAKRNHRDRDDEHGLLAFLSPSPSRENNAGNEKWPGNSAVIFYSGWLRMKSAV